MDNKLLKNDFFTFVNQEWLKNTPIPADRSEISSYSQKSLEIDEELRKLMKNWAKNEDSIPNEYKMREMVHFYKMLIDEENRNKSAWASIKNEVNLILNTKSYSEIYENLEKYEEVFAFLPLEINISEDFINNKIYTIWANDYRGLLPSKEYYEDEEKKNKIFNAIRNVVTQLMKLYGFENSRIESIVKKAFEFDQFAAQFMKSSEEKADTAKYYNPYKMNDFLNIYNNIDAKSYILDTIKELPNQIIVENPKYIDNYQNIYNQDNFDKFISLILVKNFLFYGSFLTEETRKIYFELTQALTGAKENKTLEKWAYYLTLSYFGEVLSLYYGKKNFSDEAKEDVKKMVYKIIDVYKERLEKNTWLSRDTIKMAIKKLEKIQPMVGYPGYIEKYFDDFKILNFSEGGNLLSNFRYLDKVLADFEHSKYNQNVDENIWHMGSYEVNAYFNPFSNRIVFPAGYLQAPFYDYNASSGKNYGGLGMTIGHEISHAFDNNGAQFDENGSFKNWWTEQDYDNFKNKTQKMIDLFDNYKTEYGKVNGKLTVSENIADNGGIVSALIAGSSEKDFDLNDFFTNYAYCERGYANKEHSIRRLLTDVHSPAKERVNLQLKNIKEFQEFYNLDEGDKLFSKKEEIFEIW
ncbi:M13 family peptidase [Mycoplasmopsis anatis]|uniref:Neutral endopeptidase (Endopeptidase O) n=1 Tax=Mycoplasmopsis anatis 1340 TaxID=1034808 RepID=F9QD90_9BACT|nr:M13 family metallopeptidase [Mycoplasmopsis anatis]AWX70213.1 M13 family peptidase [Mycoplasmopsis anatis]EGS29348.1 neutral endopeptidase (Endopeptidase O) [Mycoplasmopsis anatis 1340]VEU74145.1 Neutral endopeptidase [Mycoplasmopsis anatis]